MNSDDAVLVDLRPLVALPRVLDGQLVQAELFLKRRELRRFGILQRHPDETLFPGEMGAHVGQGNVGEFLSAVVGDAIDDHSLGRSRCLALYIF